MGKCAPRNVYGAEFDGDLALARSLFGLDAADDYCAFGCFVGVAAPELEVPFFFFFFFFGAVWPAGGV